MRQDYRLIVMGGRILSCFLSEYFLLADKSRLLVTPLTRVQWRQTENDRWQLEADNAETARRDDQKFSLKHLTDCESDNEMKVQVRIMIEGLVIRLKK